MCLDAVLGKEYNPDAKGTGYQVKMKIKEKGKEPKYFPVYYAHKVKKGMSIGEWRRQKFDSLQKKAKHLSTAPIYKRGYHIFSAYKDAARFKTTYFRGDPCIVIVRVKVEGFIANGIQRVWNANLDDLHIEVWRDLKVLEEIC